MTNSFRQQTLKRIQAILGFCIAAMFSLLLAGCAGTNGSFVCNKTAGDSCQSIEQVNQRANQGDFAGGNVDSNTASNAGTNTVQSVPTPTGFALKTPLPGSPVRFGESIARIWIAPFQDKAGNYHEPSFIYTVIEPSHWIGVPAKAVNALTDNEAG